MDYVKFRLAAKTDLPDVLEMSEGVFGGIDYLPIEFLNYLRDPNRQILIAEIDGKPVGLRVLHIVDDGETVGCSCLRVHAKYRGQGIGRRIIKESRDFVKRNFQRVKFEKFSVSSEAVERLSIQKTSEDVLFHKSGLLKYFVNINAEEFSRLASFIPTNMECVNKTEFENILSQEKLCGILFKGNYIAQWQPFKPLVSNIPNGLYKEGDSMFASYSEQSDVEALSHGRWSATASKCPQLFTVCYTLDKKLLKTHLAKQVQNAILQHPGEVFLFVCVVDTSLVECASQLLMNDLSLKKSAEDFGAYQYLFLFEKFLV